MLGAGKRERIGQQVALGALGRVPIRQQIHRDIAMSEAWFALLDGLGDTTEARLANHDTVDHDLDGVFELLIKLDGLVQAADLAVDAHA